MICAVHNKLNARRNLTELAYNQLIAVPFVMMSYMAFKIRIGDIGKISDDYVLILYCRQKL